MKPETEQDTQAPAKQQQTPDQAQAVLDVMAVDAVEEALGELQREVQVRERCYPRWVGEGKMSRIDARDRMCRQIKAIEIVQCLLDTKLAPQ